MEALKILIVEDEFIIASNLKLMLEDLGYAPYNPAGSKKEAMEALVKLEIDLVILDINLNGKHEGIEIANYIKDNLHIPFIFLTSNADKETINEAKNTLPKAYLIKPFTEEDIYSAIEMAMASLLHERNNE
ncbi:MAG: response regulator, partial [Bacteroidia bacterium]|nr:response regulator [Bacteroidia bacterium]